MAKEKAVKEAVRINATISTQYALLIESGENTNADAINFILAVGEEMKGGTTTREVKASMQESLKDVNVKPVVLPNHVDALQTACLIIEKFNNEIADIKASRILSLAVRVMADKKAAGAKAHINGMKSLDDLDANTKSKKESQERDASNKPKAEPKVISNVVELVSAIHAGIMKHKPIGELDAQGLQELATITAWVMQLKNNQKAKVKA